MSVYHRIYSSARRIYSGQTHEFSTRLSFVCTELKTIERKKLLYFVRCANPAYTFISSQVYHPLFVWWAVHL